MAYGGHTPAADQHRQQLWRESVRELQEVPMDELCDLVSFPDAVMLNSYQMDIFAYHNSTEAVGRMLESPFTTDFIDKYTERTAGKLACNTAMYDDDLEDDIADDPIIRSLQEASRNHGNISIYTPEDVARAIRARRSIVAILKSQQTNLIEAIEITEPNTDKTNTAV